MKILSYIYLVFTIMLFSVGVFIFLMGFTEPFGIHNIKPDYDRYSFLFVFMIAVNRFVNEYNKQGDEIQP